VWWWLSCQNRQCYNIFHRRIIRQIPLTTCSVVEQRSKIDERQREASKVVFIDIRGASLNFCSLNHLLLCLFLTKHTRTLTHTYGVSHTFSTSKHIFLCLLSQHTRTYSHRPCCTHARTFGGPNHLLLCLLFTVQQVLEFTPLLRHGLHKQRNGCSLCVHTYSLKCPCARVCMCVYVCVCT